MPDGSQSKMNSMDAAAGGHKTDRRGRRRALISLPVRVRRERTSGGQADDISTTLDVSRTGFLFLTSCDDYRPDMAVKVTLPHDNTFETAQLARDGRVVRAKKRGDGRFVVAVSFERPAAAAAPIRGAYAASWFYTGSAVESRPLVIVIDADPQVRLSISHFLRMDGYEVIAARTLREVEGKLKTSAPCLLIAENDGADFSGHDLRQILTSTPKLRSMPLILLANSSFASALVDTSSAPNIVYVTKPFRPQRLREVVRLLLPSKEAGSHYSADF